MPVNKNKIDVSQCFLVYMAMIGDVEKTAAALDLDPKDVEHLARSEGWVAKIQRISVMSKSEEPGDYERAVNRALCYVQAHQAGQLMDRVMRLVTEMDDEELKETLSTTQKGGNRTLSARMLADLAAAIDKCHEMKYKALDDSAGARNDRRESDGGEVKASALHATVIEALNSVTNPRNVKQIIADVHAQTAKQLTGPAPAIPTKVVDIEGRTSSVPPPSEKLDVPDATRPS